MTNDAANKGDDVPQAEIDTLIAYFMSKIPVHMRDQLDYSPKSLDVVEVWLCERYSKEQQAFIVDEYDDEFDDEEFEPGWISDSRLVRGAVFYIGEVYRKNARGHWYIHVTKPDPRWKECTYPVIEDSNMAPIVCPFIEAMDAVHERYSGSVFLSQALIGHLKSIKRQNEEKH